MEAKSPKQTQPRDLLVQGQIARFCSATLSAADDNPKCQTSRTPAPQSPCSTVAAYQLRISASHELHALKAGRALEMAKLLKDQLVRLVEFCPRWDLRGALPKSKC